MDGWTYGYMATSSCSRQQCIIWFRNIRAVILEYTALRNTNCTQHWGRSCRAIENIPANLENFTTFHVWARRHYGKERQTFQCLMQSSCTGLSAAGEEDRRMEGVNGDVCEWCSSTTALIAGLWSTFHLLQHCSTVQRHQRQHASQWYFNNWNWN